MSEIIEVNGSEIKVGVDGKIIAVPIAAVRYANPQLGDKVRVYRDGETTVVVSESSEASNSEHRKVNKLIYVLLTAFFAATGVQWFMRGRIGLGIFMLLFGWWITLGVWPLVDFIISLVKLGSYRGDDFVFDRDGRWLK